MGFDFAGLLQQLAAPAQSNAQPGDATGAYLGNMVNPATAAEYQQMRQQQGLQGFLAGLGSGPSVRLGLPILPGEALGNASQGMMAAQNAIPDMVLKSAQAGNQITDQQYKKLQGMGLLVDMQARQNRMDVAKAELDASLKGGGDQNAPGTPGTSLIPAGANGKAGNAVSSTTADGTLPAEARALLDTIAGPESSGSYNIRYTPKGGANFDDLSKHPGIFEPGPEGPSSAAGRYQIVKSTWDPLAAKYGLGDFSPVSQDQAAWHLAQDTYSQKTGRNLLNDLQSGRTQDVGSALGGQWATLNRAMPNYTNNLGKYTNSGAAVGGNTSNDLPAVPNFSGQMAGNQGAPYAPSAPAAPAQDYGSPLANRIINGASQSAPQGTQSAPQSLIPGGAQAPQAAPPQAAARPAGSPTPSQVAYAKYRVETALLNKEPPNPADVEIAKFDLDIAKQGITAKQSADINAANDLVDAVVQGPNGGWINTKVPKNEMLKGNAQGWANQQMAQGHMIGTPIGLQKQTEKDIEINAAPLLAPYNRAFAPHQTTVWNPVKQQYESQWVSPPIPQPAGQAVGGQQQPIAPQGSAAPSSSGQIAPANAAAPSGQQIGSGLMPGSIGISKPGPSQEKELSGRGEGYAKYFETTNQSAEAAKSQQANLLTMRNDAENIYTGPGAETKLGLQKIMRLVEPTYDAPVASAESFIKNGGTLVRSAVRQESSKAAAQEFTMIKDQLPGLETSPLGLKETLGEFMGFNDYNMAKAAAMNKWIADPTHNSSVAGFEADWHHNVDPYTFIIQRMEPKLQDALFEKLIHSEQGRKELTALRNQQEFIEKNGWEPAF